LPDRVYPGLVAAADSAGGIVLSDLTPAEWQLVDDFEDRQYALQRVAVADGRIAWAYVWIGPPEATPDRWTPDVFAAQHLGRYVSMCKGWRRRPERVEGSTI
jgi:hypothetical protein